MRKVFPRFPLALVLVARMAGCAILTTTALAALNADEDFLRDFAQASAAEVAAGKLAAERARNAELKIFGEQLAVFHSRTLSRVVEVAKLSDVDVKGEPSEQDKGRAIRLEYLPSGSFDLTYIDAQVERQDAMVKLLQSEIEGGANPSAKQFATETLPFVQHDLDIARKLRDTVTGAASSNSYSRTP